ncbi:MAG: hypothetical protein GY715_20850 [Planctomycetes bacterium]|nr:hypothetical protein [Planctomycetota bacterium]
MRRGKVIQVVALMAATAPALPAAAAVISPVGPFAGALSEDWESFANYFNTPGNYLGNPTDIMGGAATISDMSMAVYEPGLADFSLGSNRAQVADGTKAMGIDSPISVTTIVFDDDISAFGAYWGGGNDTFAGGDIEVEFFDAAGALVDSVVLNYDEDTTLGALEWHGWESTTAIRSITYRGEYVVIDGLQATPASVPGPAAAALFAVAATIGRRRRRRS